MDIRELEVDDIIVEDRLRQEVGDTEDIEETLLNEGIGQINPIAVKQLEGGMYKLLAGERRLIAHERAGLVKIMANVYPLELSEIDELSIEIVENLGRKDLRWDESCLGLAKLHELLTERQNALIEEGEVEEDWSQNLTAKAVGYAESSISRDLRLAESLEIFPELQRCKTKKEALNVEAKIMEHAILEEKAKRARESVGIDEEEGEEIEEGEETVGSDEVEALRKIRSSLMRSYKLGDFFKLVKEIPDKTFDMVEFDPDYGIEYVGEDFGSSSSEVSQDLIMQDYTGVAKDKDTYMLYINKALDEIYRIMKDNSWLIMWFSPDPWFEPVASAIEAHGFEFKRLPGVWYKDVQMKASMAPDRYLGRSYESFFYARKGSVEISDRGRSDVFIGRASQGATRSHPTEKPIPLMQDILSTFITPGTRILIPHAGSGNTIFAAANLGIKALGFDVSETYKDRFDLRCLEWEPRGE